MSDEHTAESDTCSVCGEPRRWCLGTPACIATSSGVAACRTCSVYTGVAAHCWHCKTAATHVIPPGSTADQEADA